MISVKNLVKSYAKGAPVVKDVSFEVNRGEIVGLLGPNGAGKTTIMRILTGYLAPTSGLVEIEDKNILDDPLYIKNLIGYLPENAPQYNDMTVHEYLNFIAEVRGIEKENIEKAIEKVVTLTSIEDVVSRKINQLSKGFQKRVGLASVMIHDPKILILDEPTAGLDPNQVITFRKILRRFSEKKTIILSTHVLSEIEATCERVIIIKNGSIVANDTLQNLVNENSKDESADFSIQAEKLLEVETELNKIKQAWKIEFIKKDSKDTFRFRAFTHKDSSFEEKLKETVKKKSWKVKDYKRNNVNLEEIFSKFAGEEE
jgi:ABC-2 type transport system ATP-binding protein